jgi:hypothetical protein
MFGAGWIVITIVIAVVGLVFIGLLWAMGKRAESRYTAVTTCVYCGDESSKVCPHCGNRKIHDELMASAHAVNFEDMLGGEGA